MAQAKTQTYSHDELLKSIDEVNIKAGKDYYLLPCYEIAFYGSEIPKESVPAILAAAEAIQKFYPNAFTHWRDSGKKTKVSKRKTSLEKCVESGLHVSKKPPLLTGLELLSDEWESRTRLPAIDFSARSLSKSTYFCNSLRIRLPIDFPEPEKNLRKMADTIAKIFPLEAGYAGWSIDEEIGEKSSNEVFYSDIYRQWLLHYPALQYWATSLWNDLRNGIYSRSWLTYVGEKFLTRKLTKCDQAIKSFRESGADAELVGKTVVLLKMPGEMSPTNTDKTVGHALARFKIAPDIQKYSSEPGLSFEEKIERYNTTFPD